MPSFMVPLAGIFALIGGLSVLLGYKTKQGAWLLVLFLVLVTFSMHRFWTFTDPVAKEFQQLMFMKNFALLGAALLLTYFGSGPLSMDSPAKKNVNPFCIPISLQGPLAKEALVVSANLV